MRTRLFLILSLLIASVLVAIGAARATPKTEIAGICDASARVGAESGAAPLPVLRALTRTETGRRLEGALRPWPWTVNMEGAGFWFDTRAEALAFVKTRHAEGARSFDVGCFQINYRWHGEAFESIEAMFDPIENARYAADFLGRLKAEGGDWRAAVGRYHSRTPKYANKYKARFDRMLSGLGPAPDTRYADLSPGAAPAPTPRLAALAVASDGPRAPGGFFAANPPAHADSDRANWRGGVALSVFPAGGALFGARSGPRPLIE